MSSNTIAAEGVDLPALSGRPAVNIAPMTTLVTPFQMRVPKIEF